MSLLREIEHDAAASGLATSDLLRKCLILAYRLRNVPFREWVERELDGYPSEAELPPYRRGHRGTLKAQVVNPVRYASGVPVPSFLLPEWYRDRATRFEFREAIAILESLVGDAQSSGRTMLHSPIPPEVFADIEVFEGFSTVGMDAQLSVSVVAGVIDQVRSRALRFALEMEARSPDAGETDEAPTGVSGDVVTQIFNNTILGPVGALSQGSGDATQNVNVAIQPGDLEALLGHLRQIGVEQVDLDVLPELLSADSDESAPKPGARTQSWIGRVALKLATSAGRVGEGTAAGLLVAAIARYLGLAP